MSNDTIPVFFSADDNYAPFLATALASLVQNADTVNSYKVIVLYHNMCIENQKKIISLAAKNISIEMVSMENKLTELTKDKCSNMCTDYYTLAIYFRLFIPAMFPQYDKGIYLDSDIVVPGNLADLYNTDLEDNYFGACIDITIHGVAPFMEYVSKAVGVDSYKYINSGVLLMNLKKMRDNDFQGKFLHLLNTYHFDSVAPDQDYLNAMCFGKIKFLDHCWNTMPFEGYEYEINPKVIHYNLFKKPWKFSGIKYEDEFWKYAKISGYFDYIQDYKKNYPEEKRQLSLKYLEQMIGHAAEITACGKSFSSVLNTGRESRLG